MPKPGKYGIILGPIDICHFGAISWAKRLRDSPHHLSVEWILFTSKKGMESKKASRLMTPASTLSRARSVPLAITSTASSASTIQASQEQSGSFDAAPSISHYTVVATDCRRSALLMSSSPYKKWDSKCSESSCTSYTPALSSFGSFGGNDADQEDNVEEEIRKGENFWICYGFFEIKRQKRFNLGIHTYSQISHSVWILPRFFNRLQCQYLWFLSLWKKLHISQL